MFLFLVLESWFVNNLDGARMQKIKGHPMIGMHSISSDIQQ